MTQPNTDDPPPIREDKITTWDAVVEAFRDDEWVRDHIKKSGEQQAMVTMTFVFDKLLRHIMIVDRTTLIEYGFEDIPTEEMLGGKLCYLIHTPRSNIPNLFGPLENLRDDPGDVLKSMQEMKTITEYRERASK